MKEHMETFCTAIQSVVRAAAGHDQAQSSTAPATRIQTHEQPNGEIAATLIFPCLMVPQAVNRLHPGA